MRVAFLTNKTAIVCMPVFERLVYGENVELAHTFFYDTVSESRGSPLRIIAQFGLRRVATRTFAAVVSSLRIQLRKFLRRESIRAKSPYELAVIDDLPHSTISDVNQPETIELLRTLNLDVVLVCVCKNILRRNVLSLPGTEFVNVHPSLLPQYRGPTPTFWMLYNGERETGVTFHLMTQKLDEGEILAQLSMPLDRSKSEVQIETDVFKLAATVVDDILENLNSGLARPPLDGDEHDSSYYTYPTQAQRRALKRGIPGLRQRGSRC